MKEIDYIFENIDVKKFLRLIDKTTNINEFGKPSQFGKGIDITFEIFESVEKPNEEVTWLLKRLVDDGIFFNRVKDFLLIYKGSIAFVHKNNPYKLLAHSDDNYLEEHEDMWLIICFYSNLDKKYRLLSFYMEGKDHNDTYEVVKIYDEKPTLEVIKKEFQNFIDELNSDKLNYYSMFVEEGYIVKLTISNASNAYHYSKDLLKVFKKELNLERK